jgi:hypothetical protein
MSDFLKAGFVIGVVVLVVLSPLAVVWSLNTLFAMGIAYTWQTWLAVMVLAGAFKSNVSVKKD